jgi:hypothetical protein
VGRGRAGTDGDGTTGPSRTLGPDATAAAPLLVGSVW